MPAICGTNTGAHSEWRFNHCCFAIFNAICNDIALCEQIFAVYIDMGFYISNDKRFAVKIFSVHRHGLVEQFPSRSHRRHLWTIIRQVVLGQGGS